MKAIALALVLAAASASGALAQQLSLWDKMELRNACGPDIKAVCGAVEPGEGRMAQCIRDNVEALSQPCREVMARLRADLAGAPMDF